MTSTNNSQYFESWYINHFSPCGIVYSSKNAQDILLKNNLTPSEFLRPFGDFRNYNKQLSFNFRDGYTKMIYDFKLDFYDSKSFKKLTPQEIHTILDNCIIASPTLPKWKLDKENISKNDITPIKNIINYNSFPWFNEYESTLIECLNFQETEIYQQPLLNVFIVSSNDPTGTIDDIKRMQKPLLITEGVYDDPTLNLAIILYDYSVTNQPIAQATKDKIFKDFSNRYYHMTFGFISINSNPQTAIASYSVQDDIWKKYLHKVDLYKPDNPLLFQLDKLDESEHLRGKYISKEERSSVSDLLFSKMNTSLKDRLRNKISELLKKESEGKGIKGFFSKKKKNESKQSRNVNKFNVVNLFPSEKESYLLSALLFFTRDYEGAYSSIKRLQSDIQGKLPQYENNIIQFMETLNFLKSKTKKKVDFTLPLTEYSNEPKANNPLRQLYIVRSGCICIRMYESMENYTYSSNAITFIMTKIHETYPIELPLLREKQSLYCIITNNTNDTALTTYTTRKFALYLIKAAFSYINIDTSTHTSNNTVITWGLERNALYDIGQFFNLLLRFDKETYSFNALRTALNNHMGKLCTTLKYKEGSLFFYQNTLEFMKYISSNDVTLISELLNNLMNLLKENPQLNKQLTYCTLVEIDNASVLVIEEQDYEIEQCIKEIENKNKFKMFSNERKTKYAVFDQYSIESKTNEYSQLTDNDLKALHFLDTITNKKQISNFYIKRNYIATIGNTIYVRFFMKNSYGVELKVSKLKLIIEPNDTNIAVCEEKDITLSPHCEMSIELKLNIKEIGFFEIKGVEMKVANIANVIHLFTYKKNTSLYSHRMKRKTNKERLSIGRSSIGRNSIDRSSVGGRMSYPLDSVGSGSMSSKKQKNFFSFEIFDNDTHINIDFPKGKSITLYRYQIMYYPIIIVNNSSFNLTNITVFINDNSKGCNLLSDYIKKDIYLPKEAQTTFYIPILPIQEGEFLIKIIIKFNSTSRIKDIEVKRFLLRLKVEPSLYFNVTSQMNEYNLFENKALFNINVDTVIKNASRIANVNMSECQNVLFDKQKWKLLAENKWSIINSGINVNSIGKFYNKYMFVYDLNYVKEVNKSDFFMKDNCEDVFGYKNDNSNNSNDNDNEMNYNLVSNAFNEKLRKDNIIVIPFKLKENTSQDYNITCVFYSEVKLRKPVSNALYFKSLVKDKIKISAIKDNDTFNNESYITLTVSISKCDYLIRIIKSFIVEPNINKNDFEWIGLSKWECSYMNDINNNNNTSPYEEQFTFTTKHKGVIDVNMLTFSVKISWPGNKLIETKTIYNIGKIGGEILLEV